MRFFERLCILVAVTCASVSCTRAPSTEEPAPASAQGVLAAATPADSALLAAGCVSSPPAPYPSDPSEIRLVAWPPCDNGPLDPEGGDNGLDQIQAAFDFFSWRSFVALNWPAAAPGVPDESATIGASGTGGDNVAVWETWIESYEVFQPAGAKPAPWGTPRVPPEACQDIADDELAVLQQVGKVANVPNVLDEFSNPFKTGPVIDQTGQFARFEISMNEVMFDHIVDNELYSKAGQVKYAAGDPPLRPTGLPAVIFPHGQNESAADGDRPAVEPAVGAMMTKAAWMDLTDRPELHGRFHVKEALVYTPGEPGIEETCERRTMGLVGLHVAHKTCGAAQWVWSTFEHVDNVPAQTDIDNKTLKAHYNFYNPDCENCEPVNEPPSQRPWNPNKGGPPSQIVRLDSIAEQDPNAVRANALFQAALADVNADSVWQYYELISAQWPTQSDRKNCAIKATVPDGIPAPQFLANATLESYIQGHVPNVSSSCVECHNNATTTNALHADFTYLLERAK